MSRKSEREARERLDDLYRSMRAKGESVEADYGHGRMTRAQRKSQEKHIPWTPGPKTTGQRIVRKLFG